ncbi:hypothetical protein HNP46_004205 [Pseudomonas nitritireducens]|uniref:Uncharacterized protein n=1 Tax=Pseudomonas nitroreducens TaxID=46680 RepID=A0A7W7P307_PSENT|nr:hypothetical protein [Pseudomonas nitritireducens]MBB4865324.1 hypothetical protein [Pseudomonas nitritireducens]
MLEKICFKRFGGVPDSTWLLSPGLNVLVGDSGSGKTHALTGMYAAALEMNGGRAGEQAELFRRGLQALDPLIEAELVVRDGKGAAVVEATRQHPERTVRCTITPGKIFSTAELQPESVRRPYFLDFSTMHRTWLPQDMTEMTACLVKPLTIHELSPPARELLLTVEALVGGLIMRNYSMVYVKKEGRSEVYGQLPSSQSPLVALAAYAQNGWLQKGHTFIIDNAGAGMHPDAIPLFCQALELMLKAGAQVILASNSLFLLRELEMIWKRLDAPRAFSLGDGLSGTGLEQAGDFDGLKTLSPLAAELRQSDRYME